MASPHGDDPFLGYRGLRMCRDRPHVLRPQIRTLLRAAKAGNVEVLLRMAATLGEGVDAGTLDLGARVDTPAAAPMTGDLARHVSFASTGTDDLTRNVMASDRLDPRVADLLPPVRRYGVGASSMKPASIPGAEAAVVEMGRASVRSGEPSPADRAHS